ncbi:RNA polymerase sigma factor [Novipirellula sp.]|uniref:RNA polymerase sigma factor n=1 Tax=Novipirellula sp. TaxID=2795430 RepID=UPI003565B186
MENTSVSLLDQFQLSGQSDSWDRLLTLYGPLLRRWILKDEVKASDADDLVQDVLLAVANDIKQFEHRGHVGAFRGWLKTILLNRLRKH